MQAEKYFSMYILKLHILLVSITILNESIACFIISFCYYQAWNGTRLHGDETGLIIWCTVKSILFAKYLNRNIMANSTVIFESIYRRQQNMRRSQGFFFGFLAYFVKILFLTRKKVLFIWLLQQILSSIQRRFWSSAEAGLS